MTIDASPAIPAIELSPAAQPVSAGERSRLMADPGFGTVFTDHMVTARWTPARGWHDARLVPYGTIELQPANMALHYGQSIYEGLKAYRHADGSVCLFRPYDNAARFRGSARRLAMPELPDELFVAAVEQLVRQDRAWVPAEPERTLYLRPIMFATEAGLGIRPAREYMFLVIASPSGPYFPGGVSPVSVWLSEEYVRAVPGGTGEAKCAGNYAASLIAQAEALDEGCDQVVWLDALERRWVEEMGGMNLYFVYGEGRDAVIVTPTLTGSLLPGITRRSLLRLARDLGHRAEERRVSVADWKARAEDGSLTEVFACGTAAVITPVGSVKSRSEKWVIGAGSAGPITMRLRKTLLDIQVGIAPDTHGWMRKVV